MFSFSRVPCPECGEAVDQPQADAHTCDPQRRLEFQLRALQGEVLAFDRQLEEWLSSREGRFQVWLAAREVSGSA